MDNIVQNSENTRIIYRVKNDRTAGFVPSWDKPKDDFSSVLSSYSQQVKAPEVPAVITKPEQEFGFMDLLDMVNPMQHIPLVNFAYREISGDEIKPISKIMGGAIFGGAAGAASGLISAVIADATSHDIMDISTSFAEVNSSDNPNAASGQKSYEDLPASLLAFTQTPLPNDIDDLEHVEIASGRSAGTIAVYA